MSLFKYYINSNVILFYETIKLVKQNKNTFYELFLHYKNINE